jgi:hypothetical protein
VLEVRGLVVGLLCFWCIGEASSAPQEGTGGRFKLGEDMASFLLACWDWGVEEA